MKHLGTKQDTTDLVTQEDLDAVVAAAGSILAYPAGETISGHRAVRLLGGKAIYLDPSLPGVARLILGISRNAAVLDDQVEIQTGGVLTEPSWSWTPNMPVFCGPSGTLTQVIPSTGTLLTIGSALSATQIYIRPEPPITLN